MSNKTFDTLRFIQSIIMPLSAFISGLTELLGFRYGVEIAAALVLFDGFFGAVVQAWRKAYEHSQKEDRDIPDDYSYERGENETERD